ncbi:3-dehydroquinate synthase [Streptomyces dangxiongensis]|uniref:3-dehydroquinate synthase n=1 Tax=Streptomyces dangxiongensis TaxID=1442032 RepID=A0A3G2JDC7_9ACTN|nr:3-dehydroquinate synthase family protein [Streptomyces dangxiongensis]AYN40328.1 3-dehydroquinate synthase [Streptomyces dangxiongensis]
MNTPSGTANSGAAGDIRRIEVALRDHGYAVHIGPGARRLLPSVVRDLGARRVVVVTALPDADLPDPGVPCHVVRARDGERDKTLATVEEYCRAFVRFGLTRSDAVVAVGGGTVTDTVGLAAALYHRGVPVIHVPTTLLAQVDASVGGKTAVNLPEGKNLVGTYWQPAAVLCDTDHLATLSPRDMLSGYGEIARCAFIGAGDLRGLPLHEQIAAGVALKAAVVARDERDQGLRHILNYGHTLGHAIERATDYAWRHGEAVAAGTVFAGRLAGALGRVDDRRVAEHQEIVAHFGLPTWLPSGVCAQTLVSLMRRDKKGLDTADGALTFVLDGPDGAELVHSVPESVVRSALAAMPTGPEPTAGARPDPA